MTPKDSKSKGIQVYIFKEFVNSFAMTQQRPKT